MPGGSHVAALIARGLAETDAGLALAPDRTRFPGLRRAPAFCRRHDRVPSARQRFRAPMPRPVRLLDPAPVVGGGRPPEIGKRDRQTRPAASRTGSARSSIASCGLRQDATHQAKSFCLVRGGNATSVAKPSAGGSLSQSRSRAARCASISRSAASRRDHSASCGARPRSRANRGGLCDSGSGRTRRCTAHRAPDRTPPRNFPPDARG